MNFFKLNFIKTLKFASGNIFKLERDDRVEAVGFRERNILWAHQIDGVGCLIMNSDKNMVFIPGVEFCSGELIKTNKPDDLISNHPT